MTAEIDLDRRSKPSQRVAVALGNEEGGLRHIVLGGNGLHQRVGKPLLQRHHCRRVAAKRAISEGIDMIDWQAHDASRIALQCGPTIVHGQMRPLIESA